VLACRNSEDIRVKRSAIVLMTLEMFKSNVPSINTREEQQQHQPESIHDDETKMKNVKLSI
jgi:hypothetical protein